MEKQFMISPKCLARALGVPYYLFSDLPLIRGLILEDGSFKINDRTVPAIDGTVLPGMIALDDIHPLLFEQNQMLAPL
jgi:hypothetical protein